MQKEMFIRLSEMLFSSSHFDILGKKAELIIRTCYLRTLYESTWHFNNRIWWGSILYPHNASCSTIVRLTSTNVSWRPALLRLALRRTAPRILLSTGVILADPSLRRDARCARERGSAANQ